MTQGKALSMSDNGKSSKVIQKRKISGSVDQVEFLAKIIDRLGYSSVCSETITPENADVWLENFRKRCMGFKEILTATDSETDAAKILVSSFKESMQYIFDAVDDLKMVLQYEIHVINDFTSKFFDVGAYFYLELSPEELLFLNQILNKIHFISNETINNLTREKGRPTEQFFDYVVKELLKYWSIKNYNINPAPSWNHYKHCHQGKFQSFAYSFMESIGIANETTKEGLASRIEKILKKLKQDPAIQGGK